MKVRNYYAMTLEELNQALDEMRRWLFAYPGHESRQRVWFALRVASDAKDTYEDRQNDPYLKEAVDIFTDLTKV